MNNWIDFYRPIFSDPEAAEDFVKTCEDLTRSDPNYVAKIMMHQTKRLISIADEFSKLKPNRESLQLLFLIICVEHVSKLHDRFTGEGRSKHYVRQFFDTFLLEEDKTILGKGFIDNSSTPMKPLGIEKVIDLFYDIRCDVVHEGNYWGFSFHDGKTSMVNGDPDVIVHITLSEVRDIIVKGCIKAIQDELSNNSE